MTGLEIVESGLDFLRFAWDAIEGATTYRVGYGLEEDSYSDAAEIDVEEPTFLWSGLDPSTRVRLRVFAIREAHGQRRVGPWSDWFRAKTLEEPTPASEPRECTDEAERAVARGDSRFLDEWDGTPFKLRIAPHGFQTEKEKRKAQRILDVTGRFNDQAIAQLGYSVIEPDGYDEGGAEMIGEETDRGHFACVPRETYEITVHAYDRHNTHPTNIGQSWVACGNVLYFKNPEVTREDYDWTETPEFIVHELFHQFGFGHAAGYFNHDPDNLNMTEHLTSWGKRDGRMGGH